MTVSKQEPITVEDTPLLELESGLKDLLKKANISGTLDRSGTLNFEGYLKHVSSS